MSASRDAHMHMYGALWHGSLLHGLTDAHSPGSLRTINAMRRSTQYITEKKLHQIYPVENEDTDPFLVEIRNANLRDTIFSFPNIKVT